MHFQPPVPHRRCSSLTFCTLGPPHQRGQIEFEVVYVTPEVDSDDENVEYEDDSGHHYRLYLDELDNSSTSPSGNTSAGSFQLG